MAARASPARRKTAADLIAWLREEVSASVEGKTEVVAHGGTALTLLELKGYTKDVDFGFRSKEDFDRFSRALRRIGYRITIDSQPPRGEVFLRLESSRSIIDAVDLRFPTWNNWHLAGKVLQQSISIPVGKVNVVRPGIDAVFLFKTYPLRDTDLEDLAGILKKTAVNERRVTSMFDEQEQIYRRRLMEPDIECEPLINILEMRVRYAGSLALLGVPHRRLIPRIANHAKTRFNELQLESTLDEVVKLIREEERPIDWDVLLSEEDSEALRSRLAE